MSDGTVKFTSDAPLEKIVATSKVLRGVIEPAARTFAFTIDITSFQGFNSPLQRVHFNENYMESGTYPMATFTGKFIEDVTLTTEGSYEVRVKGKLKVHGVEKERIIKGHVEVTDSGMQISSTFTILLEDHDIRIPRVVYQKIAKVVTVEVTATLVSNKS
jgi:polyisoprenoid-binding protein YceI